MIRKTRRHVHADNIIAWAEGAGIEWYDERLKDWIDCSSPSWHHAHQYRIKLEHEPLEYVPFEWEDRDEIRGKWMKSKNKDIEFRVHSFFRDSNTTLFINGIESFDALNNYTFPDGSPFGKVNKKIKQ